MKTIKALEKLKNQLSQLLKENLTALYTYGPTENPSLLLILKTSNSTLLKPLQKSTKTLPPNTQWTLFTERECLNAIDVFPIEFLDMKTSRTLLAGTDFLNHVNIHEDHLRHECEFNLRSLLLKSREAYIKKMPEKEIIQNALPTILMTAQAMHHLFVDNEASQKDLSQKIAYFKQNPKDLTFNEYLSQLSELTHFINDHESP